MKFKLKNQRIMERIINNLTAYIWLALFIVALFGIIFKGAWWHLWTAGLCWIMFRAMYIPKDKDNNQ